MCLLDNREVRKGWQPLKDAVLGMFTTHYLLATVSPNGFTRTDIPLISFT